VKNEQEVRGALREWVVRTNGKIRADELRDDTPLIEKRIVRSLDVLDLIVLLEGLRGRAIDVEKLAPGSFRSIDQIWKVFFDGHG